MSGGVDSSTAAALLVRAGRRVFGLTMATGFNEVAVREAAEVARLLGIEHHVVELSSTFRERVLEPFCRDYAAGRTPNPCVRCNRFVKFGRLLEAALDLGAARLATGHYARVVRGDDGRFRLLRGTDRRKDQSYFLYALGQEQLARAEFPLGSLRKTEVREIAAGLGLPSFRGRESADVCFVSRTLCGEGKTGYPDLVERVTGRAARPGPIVDTAGRRVGTHRGLVFYTVGQRRGLGLAGAGRPLYVVAIDQATNSLVVGPVSEVFSGWLAASEAVFVSGEAPPAGTRVEAKVRYRSRAAPAEFRPLSRQAPPQAPAGDGGFRLHFDEPQRAVAPGQAAVLYDGDEVLGGGVIITTEARERVLPAPAPGSALLGPGDENDS
jgi:tRNA-specific 2-thiouridylase